MLKSVVDTNVFVSSLLSRSGAPAQIIDAWREKRFLLCCSPAILAEVQRVLNYPNLRDKYYLTTEDIDGLLALLRHDTLMVPGKIDIDPVIPADPNDEIFLICAVEADADLIVSGDRHLLALVAYEGTLIVTVQELLDMLAA